MLDSTLFGSFPWEWLQKEDLDPDSRGPSPPFFPALLSLFSCLETGVWTPGLIID